MAKDNRKEVFYFPHDYGARNDIKIKSMRRKWGSAGLGYFWVIVEMLWEAQDHKLPLKAYLYETLSEEFGIAEDEAQSYIKDCIDRYELFKSDGEFFWSHSVMDRASERDERLARLSEARSKAVKARWDREKNTDTNVIQNDTNVIQMDTRVSTCNTSVIQNDTAVLHPDTNGYKPIQGKEKKEKESKDNDIKSSSSESQIIARTREEQSPKGSDDDVFFETVYPKLTMAEKANHLYNEKTEYIDHLSLLMLEMRDEQGEIKKSKSGYLRSIVIELEEKAASGTVLDSTFYKRKCLEVRDFYRAKEKAEEDTRAKIEAETISRLKQATEKEKGESAEIEFKSLSENQQLALIDWAAKSLDMPKVGRSTALQRNYAIKRIANLGLESVLEMAGVHQPTLSP